MKLDCLYLIGGPLDGTYMPANPLFKGLPTEIAIYAKEYGWHLYQDPKAGGVAKVDVYKIVTKRDNSFMRPPHGASLHEMEYLGALPPDRAQEIERLVRGRYK